MSAATSTKPQEAEVPAVVLGGITYGTYLRIRDAPENYHVRMLYHDGTLEIMSPEHRHEITSKRIAVVVRFVALALAIPYSGCGSTTCRIGEPKRKKGSGAEPDEGFYFANEPLVR